MRSSDPASVFTFSALSVQALICWVEASSRCSSSGSTTRRASETSCPDWEPRSRTSPCRLTGRCSAPHTVTTVRKSRSANAAQFVFFFFLTRGWRICVFKIPMYMWTRPHGGSCILAVEERSNLMAANWINRTTSPVWCLMPACSLTFFLTISNFPQSQNILHSGSSDLECYLTKSLHASQEIKTSWFRHNVFSDNLA